MLVMFYVYELLQKFLMNRFKKIPKYFTMAKILEYLILWVEELGTEVNRFLLAFSYIKCR